MLSKIETNSFVGEFAFSLVNELTTLHPIRPKTTKTKYSIQPVGLATFGDKTKKVGYFLPEHGRLRMDMDFPCGRFSPIEFCAQFNIPYRGVCMPRTKTDFSKSGIYYRCDSTKFHTFVFVFYEADLRGETGSRIREMLSTILRESV